MNNKLKDFIKNTIDREKYLEDFNDFCFAPFIKIIV